MITNENYFSPENERKYMGSTQFKSFKSCEAAAVAKLRGEYQEVKSTALLVGSYVDAHFEGSLDVFKAQNPQIFKRDGGLKSDYEQANYIINRLERDELFMLFMAGKKQVIRTGEISGVPFKIKIDSYLSAADCETIIKKFPALEEYFWMCDGAVVDLKAMKDFQPLWVTTDEGGEKKSFVEAWGYDTQAAIYHEVEGNMLPFFIAGATKEKPEPDIGIFPIPQDKLDEALYEVEELAPYFDRIKKGEIEPRRCEKCAYCRSTKVLAEMRDYREVV